MTIPFLAIISCLLLASNNPGSLHGILAVETRATPTWSILEKAYVGPYEPVDLWDRGPNKMYWFQKTVEQYQAMNSLVRAQNMFGSNPGLHHQHHANHPYGQQPSVVSNGSNMGGHPPSTSQFSGDSTENKRGQLKTLRQRMNPRKQDWCLIFGAAVIPLTASFMLAFITSFNTPRVGLACRSLTHLLYFATQLIQMILWMYRNRVVLDDDNKPNTLVASIRNAVFIFLTLLIGLLAAFVSVGGTLMQLIGVYRNCLCKVSATWFKSLVTQEICH